MRFLWATIVGLPSWTLIALVRLYQFFLSPFLGRQCRFQPTCSHYFIGAVNKYGALRGTAKGVWRILRCNPFCPGGWDPP
jgi:putative membrane protein insertion efficiency factor